MPTLHCVNKTNLIQILFVFINAFVFNYLKQSTIILGRHASVDAFGLQFASILVQDLFHRAEARSARTRCARAVLRVARAYAIAVAYELFA